MQLWKNDVEANTTEKSTREHHAQNDPRRQKYQIKIIPFHFVSNPPSACHRSVEDLSNALMRFETGNDLVLTDSFVDRTL